MAGKRKQIQNSFYHHQTQRTCYLLTGQLPTAIHWSDNHAEQPLTGVSSMQEGNQFSNYPYISGRFRQPLCLIPSLNILLEGKSELVAFDGCRRDVLYDLHVRPGIRADFLHAERRRIEIFSLA